jgi:phosphomannomutase
VESIADKIEEVRAAFDDGEQDMIDGLTVQYDSWWFNLRPSNTEPLLRLNVEASDSALLQKKTKELLRLIRS